MITLTIDNLEVQVPEGMTILSAAESVGIRIPTLCFAKGFKPSTSCMVCVVRVEGFRHLVPACGTLAADGMVATTVSDEIVKARKTAIELLLSDHVGDCVGPCEKGCPAKMNIPLMIRQIAVGQLEEAIATVKKDIALPAILGRICEAPCEKVCRRAQADEAVTICLLKRFVADSDLASEKSYKPECLPQTGKKVAIIGAGPSGLAAAYYLAQAGIACTLYDKANKPGGWLLSGDIDKEILPPTVVEAEIEQIFKLGPVFTGNNCLGADVYLDELKSQYDAVLLAVGQVGDDVVPIGIDRQDGKIAVNRQDYSTSLAGVFAAGACIGSRNVCVRAIADGKEAAQAMISFLSEEREMSKIEYNHRMGRLKEGEMPIFLKHASANERTKSELPTKGLTKSQAQQESQRCLHCDCHKADRCGLRDLATATGAEQRAFAADRAVFEQIVVSDGVIFEPGKCIKCGLCVQAAKKHSETLGLSFEGRGYTMRPAVPFEKDWTDGLKKAVIECVKVCPTGALASKD